jgi:uncharacterized protein
MRRLRLRVPAPEGLRVELIGVPPGADLDLDLRLEAVVEGVLASGSVVAPVTGECGRCLERVDDTLAVDFQELYAYPGSTTGETTDSDELPRLDGDLLDLEPVLRDAVVLALPLTPLCSADCLGLCPTCGERLTPGEPAHDHRVVDPRWAALARFSDNHPGGHNGSGDGRGQGAGASQPPDDATGTAGS